MRYLLVGCDPNSLEEMEWSLQEVIGEEMEILRATSTKEALEIVKANEIDVAFVDTDDASIDGEKLASDMKKQSKDIYVVIVTAYDIYGTDGWSSFSDKTVVKPLDSNDIRKAINKITNKKGAPKKEKNHAINLSNSENDDFEIMCNGRPVHFARRKSKEMVAYLLKNKGAYISSEELGLALWKNDEDAKEKKAYIRVLANDIRKGFGMVNITDVLVHSSNGYSLNLSKVYCD